MYQGFFTKEKSNHRYRCIQRSITFFRMYLFYQISPRNAKNWPNPLLKMQLDSFQKKSNLRPTLLMEARF